MWTRPRGLQGAEYAFWIVLWILEGCGFPKQIYRGWNLRHREGAVNPKEGSGPGAGFSTMQTGREIRCSHWASFPEVKAQQKTFYIVFIFSRKFSNRYHAFTCLANRTQHINFSALGFLSSFLHCYPRSCNVNNRIQK